MGHDLHMTVFLGTAKMMAETKDKWGGTLVLIGQPAEKRSRRSGDAACGLVTQNFEAGLCDCAARFLLPAAGTVRGMRGPSGGADSWTSDSGYGGHGAMPYVTKIRS